MAKQGNSVEDWMANATQTAEADLGAGLSGNDTRRMAAQRRAGRERQKQILNLQN